MDNQPYSPAPQRAETRPARLPAMAAGLALLVAGGLAGYRLGRRAAPLEAPVAVQAPATTPAPAAGVTATREFVEVDLGGAEQRPLAPLDQSKAAAADEFVLFKRGIVHLGARPGEIQGGRPIDVKVDGKPQRVYTKLSESDPRMEEIIVAAQGRDKPHVVDWGTSESRWDGAKITWSPKR